MIGIGKKLRLQKGNFKGDRKMNVKIKEFISTNKNTGVTWNIDGQMFTGNNFIPSHLLEKYVIDWTVNQWRGIIIITTECNK